MKNVSTLPGRSNETGFTLIELIITLVIGAILMAVAVPSFTEFLRQSQLTSQTNDFLGAVNIARSEAVKRSQSVTMCASADNSATVPTCGGAAWDDGWIVFTDPDNNEVLAAGEALIISHDPLDDSGVLASTDPAITSFYYLSRGAIDFANSAVTEATISSSVGDIDNVRCITLNAAGRPAVEPTPCI